MAELADISNTIVEFLELAERQLAESDTSAAEQTARAVISLSPSTAAGWHMLGEILSLEPGRRAEAADSYERALKLDPKNVLALGGRQALSERATAAPTNADKQPILPHLAAMGGKDQLIADARAAETAERWKEAQKCWQAVLEQDPSDTWAWSQYGHLLSVHLHDYVAAEAAFRRAIEEDATDDWAWGKLGIMIADFQGRVVEGQELLREAIRLDPSEPYYHGWLGWSLYRQSENLLDAEKELFEATRLQPDYQWAHFHLGYVRYVMGTKPKLARTDLLRAVELEPGDIAALYNLGALYGEQLGQDLQAEKCFLKVLEIDADHIASHFKLATLYERKEATYGKAQHHYQQILLSHPKDLTALRCLAYLYYEKMARYEDARQVFVEAISVAPEDADLHYRFGCLLWYDLSEGDLGISHLQRATQLAPDIELGWASLGEAIAATSGDYESAEECFLKALELEPDYFWVHAHYGVMLTEEMGRHDDAAKHLQMAVEIEPDYAWGWTQYGKFLSAEMHDFEGARLAFEAAIAADAEDFSPLFFLVSMDVVTLKRPDRAKERLAELASKLPDSGLVEAFKALSLRSEAMNDPAVDKLFERSTDLTPGSHWCLHTRAEHLLYVRGDIGEAEEMLLRSMRLENDCPTVSSDLGLIRLAQGEHDIARALYEKALEVDDEDAYCWRLYGLFLSYIDDDPALIEEAFERAIKYGEHNFENYLFLAAYLKTLPERIEEARELWDRAQTMAPKGFDLEKWATLYMRPLILRHMI